MKKRTRECAFGSPHGLGYEVSLELYFGGRYGLDLGAFAKTAASFSTTASGASWIQWWKSWTAISVLAAFTLIPLIAAKKGHHLLCP